MASEEHTDGADANESSFLLPPGDATHITSGLLAVPGLSNGESAKYGTFREGRAMHQTSNPTTRAPSPSPAPSRTVSAMLL